MKKHFLVAPVLLAVVLAVHSPDATAACTIDQPNMPATAYCPVGHSIGQSFTACQTGFVTSVSFNVYQAVTGPLDMELQAGTTIGPQSTPQSVSVVVGPNTIVLDTPFPVTNGTLYSFGLKPTSGILIVRESTGNPYAGGGYIEFDGTTYLPPGSDLSFTVQIVTDIVPARPTTWGSIKTLYR